MAGLPIGFSPSSAIPINQSSTLSNLYNVGANSLKSTGAMPFTNTATRLAARAPMALPAAILAAPEVGSYLSNASRESGQTIPTAMATTTRPATSWNQPMSTMSISSKPMTFGTGEGYGGVNEATKLASAPKTNNTPLPSFNSDADQEKQTNDFIEKEMVPNQQLATEEPKSPTAAPPAALPKPTVRPDINVPEYNGKKVMDYGDVLAAVGYGSGANSDPAHMIAANNTANGMLSQNNAQVGQDQELYKDKLSAMPQFEQVNLNKSNPEFSPEMLQAKLGLAGAQTGLVGAQSELEKNKLAMAPYELALRYKAMQQHPQNGVNNQTERINDILKTMPLEAADPTGFAIRMAQIKRIQSLHPSAFNTGSMTNGALGALGIGSNQY